MRVQVLVVAAVLGSSLFGAVPARAAGWCRSGNPQANVYAPGRLKVYDRCRSVSGTISDVIKEHDGDEHLYLKVDRQYQWMLDRGNMIHHGGTLVLEIVPADQPGCTKGRPVKDGVCTGAHLHTPKVGSRITATGPFVYDRTHGWNEIHPVWQIA